MVYNYSTFLETLNEDVLTEARKNTHLTHLEDVVLDDGPSGVSFAIDTLTEFGHILNGGTVSKSLNVTVKWDGAPAIIFGRDPADGKFFVATKGAFAKTPKLAKSHADVDSYWSGGLAAKMHVALDEFAKLDPKTVVQGDLLFTPEDIKTQSIDGKTYYAFQPNTIMYAVDVQSTLGQQIAAAKIGVVVHTMYTGRGDLASYSATAISPAVFSSMRPARSVLLLDAGYDDVSGTATFTTQESSDFFMLLDKVEMSAEHVPASIYNYILEEPLHSYIAQFVNAQVRAGAAIDPKMAPKRLWTFIHDLGVKDVAAKKTQAGQDAVAARYSTLLDTVTKITPSLTLLFTTHQYLTQAKNMVIRKLGQSARVASFIQTDTGLKVTGPEGFVAVAHSGKAVKLVDRLEFSRANFSAIKSWR
jgi:Family of unknown function (DUF6267)